MKKIYFVKGMTCGGCKATVQKELSKIDEVESVEVDLPNQSATIISENEIPFFKIKESLANTHYDIFLNKEDAQTQTYYIQGMTCTGCQSTVHDRLSSIEGVESVKIDLEKKEALVKMDRNIPLSTFIKALDGTHYSISKDKATHDEANHENPNTQDSDDVEYYCPMMCEGEKTYDKPGNCPVCGMDLVPVVKATESSHEDEHFQSLKSKFWKSFAFTLPIFIIAMSEMIPNNPLYAIMPQIYWNWVQLFLSIPVVFVFCWMFFERAWRSLLTFKFNMFTLVGIGSGIAWLFSLLALVVPEFFPHQFKNNDGNVHLYFESTTVILTLVMMGQMLEARAHGKTNTAIKKLLNLAPKNATIIRDGQDEEIDINQIKINNLLRVKPGEKVPVDGIIQEGHTELDESMISGEPIPVDKKKGDKVIAGTINGSSSFVMKAEKVGKDTLLSQIIEMVNQASRSRAEIQKLADVISSYFVPIVVSVAVITFIVWAIFGPSPSYVYALVNAIAVLIIACPCALGLATPMSIMVGVGKGAQNGILIKQANTLEKLNKIDTLIIDKTGTITEGNPAVESIESFNNHYSKESLLKLMATINNHSEHPLAKSIMKYAKEKKIAPGEAQNFKSHSGLGVEALIDGERYYLGNAKLMKQKQLSLKENILDGEGGQQQNIKTVSFIANDKEVFGMVSLEDKIKPTSFTALKALKDKGIGIYMLTGDNEYTAKSVAEKVGIDHYVSEALPQDKLNFVKKLQSQGKYVAVAGDGINDAPALAQANVGISMGTGTDVAIESSDLTLVKGDLNGIVKAIKLGEIVLSNIKQNLFFALIYNAIGVPVASGILFPFFGVLLSPMIAAVAMSFSSVSVIANALRLKGKEL